MRREQATDVTLAVMARAPEAGRAKTRLVPTLGARGAARLHESLARRTVAEACETDLPVALWCAPDRRHPFFEACAAQFGVTLRDQPQGDLGERMHRIFDDARGSLLLMGSDCPTIDARLIRTCARALDETPAVFLPTEDGGYGLVGLRRPIPEIFEGMAWGVDTVMSETRRRLTTLGVAMIEPATIWDVDRPEDVVRLASSGFPIPAFAD